MRYAGGMRCVPLLFALAMGLPASSPRISRAESSIPERECSEATKAELTRRMAKRWPGAEVRSCAAGRFGAAGYVVDVHGENFHRLGVLAADGGADLGAFVDVRSRGVATSVLGHAAVDLDGDGVDEIVEWWRKSAHGRMGSDNWLDVRRLQKGKLSERIAGPHVSVFIPELGSCNATWKVDANSIVVAVESTRELPPSSCLPVGRHRFRLEKDTLVEVR